MSNSSTGLTNTTNSIKHNSFLIEKYLLWLILSVITLASTVPVFSIFPTINLDATSSLNLDNVLDQIEESNEISATLSLFFLAITLSLSPLLLLLNRNFDVITSGKAENTQKTRRIHNVYSVLRRLARHKRTLGVFAFVTALVHALTYFLERFINAPNVSEVLQKILSDFGTGTYLVGWIAFLIFFALAVTSTNYAVRILGGRRWKNLHRLVYISIVAIFLHVLLKGEEVGKVVVFLGPIVLLEIYRLKVYWQKKLIKE